MDHPRELPRQPDLLSQHGGTRQHPKFTALKLHGWSLSSKLLHTDGNSKTIATCVASKAIRLSIKTTSTRVTGCIGPPAARKGRLIQSLPIYQSQLSSPFTSLIRAWKEPPYMYTNQPFTRFFVQRETPTFSTVTESPASKVVRDWKNHDETNFHWMGPIFSAVQPDDRSLRTPLWGFEDLPTSTRRTIFLITLTSSLTCSEIQALSKTLTFWDSLQTILL